MPAIRTPTPKEQLDAAIKATKKAKVGKGRSNWTPDSRGRMHPSGGEAKWFDHQYALERAGLIAIIEIEPAFEIKIPNFAGELVHGFTVKADMKVRELKGHGAGTVRYLDYKGHTGDTEQSRRGVKCVLIQYGVQIEWVGKYVEQKARRKRAKAQTRDLLKKSKKQSAQRC